MADRHWTIVLVPDGAGRSRTLRVPVRAFQFAAGFTAVAAVVVSVLSFTAISRAVDLSRLDRMERRNDVLAEEITRAGFEIEHMWCPGKGKAVFIIARKV